MQLEPMPESDGYRVWLSGNEQERLVNFYQEQTKKEIAVRGMLSGLRTDELEWIRADRIRELDAETESYKLKVADGKTGYREVPVSRDFVSKVRIYRNAAGLNKDAQIITEVKRTVRRWVTSAGAELASETGNSDWSEVSPHDLRRSWATSTFYSLSSPHAQETIMRWGGWSDPETFQSAYLGRETDELAAEMMEESGLL